MLDILDRLQMSKQGQSETETNNYMAWILVDTKVPS